ncbi:MAG: tRNA (N6-isopentenyl adenosine(37)-C2)-methylthiotransferase MiaB [Deltaproteobacteria bacterium]|nr:tRNA (N6-isopentenyl adenosine(37)-C2)-methylthiotransferase MiaB [Deltaproteobacteria bacterium]
MKKVYIQTLGCQMNEYDSQRALGLLAAEQYLPTEDPQEADLIFLNTCTVREKPEQKVYSHLGEFQSIKKGRPEVILAVAGCVAQQEGEELLKRVPYLDLVIGTHNLHQLPRLVQEIQESGERRAVTDFHKDVDSRFLNLVSDRLPNPISSFLTIMEGCDKFCAFCVVPYVRGRELSRPAEKIIEEVEQRVEQGVKEITLLGQNVNSYGKKGETSLRFVDLLRRIDAIPKLERIRFTSSYPRDFDEEQMSCFRDLSKLCEHLHLPVQSGSNRILEKMRRKHSREDYLEKIERFRELCPEAAISTDLIVGFPGETEQDFQDTLSLVEQIQFDSSFCFQYSSRPETPAASYEEQVPEEVKKERLQILLELQNQVTRDRLEKKIGAVGEVLVERVTPKQEGWVRGRLRTNEWVHLQGTASWIGKKVNVVIEEALGHSFRGKEVESDLKRRTVCF